jgi:hypothetical protein
MSKRFYDDGEAYHVCDHCGHKLMEGELERTGIFITIIKGSDVRFEWWNKGEYCYECSDALFRAIYDSLPVPERCTKEFRDEDMAKAIEDVLIVRGLGTDS